MKLSVCITLKNRAEILRDKLVELDQQTFPSEDIEVCVTDGGSSDGLLELLEEFAPRFDRITYARSDRDALPFRVPFNNPVCDINAQVCNVATHDHIVRTDAEVRFLREDALQYIANVFEKRPGFGLEFTCYRMGPTYRHDWPTHRRRFREFVERRSNNGFFCVCFRKQDFVARGGVDERFALGFAAEDSHFCWWWRKNGWLLRSHKDQRVAHLYHGEVRTKEAARLWREYTMPLYQMMKHYKVRPNAGNLFWQRPEMISDVRVWEG
jgi:glycosyltransferase involved in cell wall biosynthesis